MVSCNGIAGLCLLVTALRRRVAVFNAEGTGAALATVITLATLSLVLPAFTTGTPGPQFTGPGRATLLQAGVHLAIGAAFIFLAASP